MARPDHPKLDLKPPQDRTYRSDDEDREMGYVAGWCNSRALEWGDEFTRIIPRPLIGALLLLSLWHWNPVPEAEGYYLYRRDSTAPWSACQRAQVVGSAQVSDYLDPVPGQLLQYVVTAYNAGGESPTEHGPIVECP
jgi:hypothetical protein